MISEFPSLEPDCASCAALCCVVFAFDKSESFALDKGAGEPCPNLRGDNGCQIFADRSERGFKGCITYTCHGAGQVVSRGVFRGRDWREDPVLKERMGAALSVLRRIHEQMVVLKAASTLPLSAEHSQQLEKLVAVLLPDGQWTEGKLSKYPIDRVCREVAEFLQGLQGYFSR